MISVTSTSSAEYAVYETGIEVHRNLLYLAAGKTEYFAVSVVIGFPRRGHDPAATLHDHVFTLSNQILDCGLCRPTELRGDSVKELLDDVLLPFNRARKFRGADDDPSNVLGQAVDERLSVSVA